MNQKGGLGAELCGRGRYVGQAEVPGAQKIFPMKGRKLGVGGSRRKPLLQAIPTSGHFFSCLNIVH